MHRITRIRRPTPGRFAPPLAVGLLVTILVACSSATSASPSASASASASAAAGGSGAAASGQTVTLKNFAFSPTTLTVPAGTTVTFKNEDPTEHTVTNGKDGKAAADAKFDEKLPTGQSVTVTFDTPGTYDVTCTIHSSMNMTVTVQ
jgi:plastocyanin